MPNGSGDRDVNEGMMDRAGPLSVYGPITPFSPAVRVTGVFNEAAVEILEDGTPIGTMKSPVTGELWVPLTTAPTIGRTIKATQDIGGGRSELPLQGILVVAAPDALPTPVIVSAVNSCMSEILVVALVPGATVRAEVNGIPLAALTATRPQMRVPLDLTKGIPPDAQILVRQELKVNGALLQSAAGSSIAVPAFVAEPPRTLPAPEIGPPLESCQTTIAVNQAVAGAVTTIDNEGSVMNCLNTSQAFVGRDAIPLREGALLARQEMPRCGLVSPVAKFTVVKAGKPAAPTNSNLFCPETRKLSLANLRPGGGLRAYLYIDLGGGSISTPPIAVWGIAETSQTFDLPPSVIFDTGDGPVRIGVEQILCGSPFSDACLVRLSPGINAGSKLKLEEPVHDCARVVLLSGARPGASVEIFDEASGLPLSDSVTVTGPGEIMPVRLWFAAVAGRVLVARQSGCNSEAESKAPVQALPSPLPRPSVVGPVRPAQTWVQLKSAMPGALVHIFVAGSPRTSIETLVTDPVILIGGPPLADRQSIQATQELCGQHSRPGDAATATRGAMVVEVVPKELSPGIAVNVRVVARDKDTGADIVGQVHLAGKQVGVTGQSFSFTADAGAPGPVSGVVKEPVAYLDAPFSIPLAAPNWLLSLALAPTKIPLPGLTVNLDAVTWKIVPKWDSSLAKTEKRQPTPPNFQASAVLPAPPGSEKGVLVETNVEWSTPGGMLGGYTVQPQSRAFNLPAIAVGFDGKAKRVGWSLALAYREVENGIEFEPSLIVSFGIE